MMNSGRGRILYRAPWRNKPSGRSIRRAGESLPHATTLLRLIVFLAVFSCRFPVAIVHSAGDVPDPAEESSAIGLETIASGRSSAYPCRMPTLLIIRDQEDWERNWGLHHGRGGEKPEPPQIDFGLFSVIALFSGHRTTVEDIEIAQLQRSGDRVVVSAREVEPGLGCPGPGTVLNPFHIVKVPALTKGTALALEIEILLRSCAR